MKKEDGYNNEFYSTRYEKTRYAAECVLNIITTEYKIQSCIDIGCGIGTWLKTLKIQGGGYIGD